MPGAATLIFPFLVGVVESSGFYQPQPDVNRILEVGCGYGTVLDVFRRKGFTAVGTEASPTRAQSCRARGLNVFDCPTDNFDPIQHLAPFDLAYSIHVLEHIVDPGPHIRNLAALIRDGGYLYIQVPHLMYEVNVVHRCHSAVHCNSFSPRSLALLLQQHGFAVLRIQADNNIHILARKTSALTSAFTTLQAHRNTADPAGFLDLFQALASDAGTPLRLTWDHAYFTITRDPRRPGAVHEAGSLQHHPCARAACARLDGCAATARAVHRCRSTSITRPRRRRFMSSCSSRRGERGRCQ